MVGSNSQIACGQNGVGNGKGIEGGSGGVGDGNFQSLNSIAKFEVPRPHIWLLS